jgi:hypothetical protein
MKISRNLFFGCIRTMAIARDFWIGRGDSFNERCEYSRRTMTRIPGIGKKKTFDKLSYF